MSVQPQQSLFWLALLLLLAAIDRSNAINQASTMATVQNKTMKQCQHEVERCKRHIERFIPSSVDIVNAEVPVDRKERVKLTEQAKAAATTFDDLRDQYNDRFQEYSAKFYEQEGDIPEDVQRTFDTLADYSFEFNPFRSALNARIARLESEIAQPTKSASPVSLSPQPTNPPFPAHEDAHPQLSRAPSTTGGDPYLQFKPNMTDGRDDRQDDGHWPDFSGGSPRFREFRPARGAGGSPGPRNSGYGYPTFDASDGFHRNDQGQGSQGTEHTQTGHMPHSDGHFSPHSQMSGNQMVDFANILADAFNRSRPPPNPNGGYARLPQIDLPKFSGKYADWQAFWDRFERTVDKHPTMSKADKLVHLVSRMNDEPAKLIKNLPTTNDNYDVAVRTLKTAFDNPAAAMENVLSRIYNLKPVTKFNMSGLKDFYYEVENLVGCLQALGRDHGSDYLVGLLLKKLPLGVVISIERTKDRRQEWTMSLLREGLQRELDIQESSRRHVFGADSTYHGKFEKNSEFQNLTTTEAFFSNEGQSNQKNPNKSKKDKTPKPRHDGKVPNCVYCDQEHYSNECGNYPTAKERKKILSDENRCFKCLTKMHDTSKCKSQKRCFHCHENGKHHSSICPSEYGPPSNQPKKDQKKDGSTDSKQEESKLADDESTIMKTAIVEVQNPEDPTKTMKIRAFMDTGTSRTFLTERMANKLSLKTDTHKTLRIRRYGSDNESPLIDKVKTAFVDLKALDGRTIRIKVAVSGNAMKSMSKSPIPSSMLKNLPKGVKLADDPLPAHTEVDVDFMIGNDHYEDLLTGKRLPIEKGFWLVESAFGWIPSGRIPNPSPDSEHAFNVASYKVLADNISVTEELAMVERECDGNLEDLWSLESIGINGKTTDQTDDFATENFNNTVLFANGRYQVTWPWKLNVEELPTNHGVAVRRLRSLLGRRRANSDWDFLDRYNKIIQDQLEKGVIEKVNVDHSTGNRIHYLAHHGVETPLKTTKLRVVYDGSARESPEKPCLNDCVYRGPVILENLLSLLLRFRCKPIAVTADIEKAFLQVGLQQHERDVTRFLWVKDYRKPPTQDNIEVYRFQRVSFGVKASPFLLGATLKHHLKKESTEVAKQISDHLYVDNLITGVQTEKDAMKLYTESKDIFKRAGMNLREYVSNSRTFVSQLPDADKVLDSKVKVLGLTWFNESDKLGLRAPLDETDIPGVLTKKRVLSQLFKIFDPLGIASPVTVRGRLLLQKLTKQKCGWNTVLSSEDARAWENLKGDLLKVGSLEVPRYIGAKPDSSSRIMAFCDASKQAYAAVVYLQVKIDGQYSSQLMMTKARVNPMKELSIPRLELMAMLIAARLVDFVRKCISFTGQTYLWSDSKCVLHWIKSDKLQTPFVENRLKEIRRIENAEFHYVPTKENPADRASRGASFNELDDVWWHGPKWACQDEPYWPPQDLPLKPSASELAEEGFVAKDEEIHDQGIKSPFDIIETNFSSLTRLIRVTAWCQRLIDYSQKLRHTDERLTAHETALAMMKWVKHQQQINFPSLLDAMKRNKSHCLIRDLGTKMDDKGIVRCHGRLSNMDQPDDTKYPILLPSKSHFTNLIISECHERNFHSGIGQTVACVRKQFWVPKIRSRVRTIIKNCLTCKKYDGGPFERPIMPELPKARVTRSRPFEHVGLDYFGPLFVKVNHEPEKRWICIFTCLSVRAVHLEVVIDQSAHEFMLAFQRFVAIRGKPSSVLCDNATQFKAVRAADPFSKFLCGNHIEWHFIPQLAPWAGGVYERLIKIIKSSLKKTLGRKLLSHQELVTIIAEVQLAVNSRPLTYQTDDVNDVRALTPNNLLGLEGIQCVPVGGDKDPAFDPGCSTKEALLKSFEHNARILESFWSSWSDDYLLSLRERTSYFHKDPRTSIRVQPIKDQVVLIKEDLQPRQKWLMGRIVDVVPGKDGKIRAAKIRIGSKKILIRPVNLLFPLECEPVTPDRPNERGYPLAQERAPKRIPRQSAINARQAIKGILSSENDIPE